MKNNRVLTSLIVLLSLLMLFVLPFAFLFELPDLNAKLFFVIDTPSIIGVNIKDIKELGYSFLFHTSLFIMRMTFFVSYILFNVFGVICIYKILKNKKSIGMLKIMLVMLFIMISMYVYNAEDGMGWFAVPVGCVVSLILLIIAIILERKKNGCVINYKFMILQMMLLANIMVPLFVDKNYEEVIWYEWISMSWFIEAFLTETLEIFLGAGVNLDYAGPIVLIAITLLAILVMNILIFFYNISDGQSIINKRKTLFFYGVNIIVYVLSFVLYKRGNVGFLVGLHIFVFVSVIGFIMALIDIRKDKIKNIDIQNQ